MLYSTNIIIFLSKLSQNLSTQKVEFKEKKNRKLLSLLKILSYNKTIKHYNITNYNNMKIVLFYFSNKSTLKSLYIFSKDSFKRHINFNKISSLFWKFSNFIFYLSTSHGLLTNKDILKKKLGGLIIARCL